MTCFKCQYLSHIKQTREGDQAVCGLPGVPRNWRKNQLRYVDIAYECNCYEEASNEATI